MEIVINIPDEIYKNITWQPVVWNGDTIRDAIKNGTPLPKGHGRLIDADALLRRHSEFDTYPFPSATIDNAPTIIEADK